MSIPGGYILVPRMLFAGDLFSRPPWEWKLALHMLDQAADGDPPGTLTASVSDLQQVVSYSVGARTEYPDKPSISRFMQRQQSAGFLTFANTIFGYSISLNDYGLWQNPDCYEDNAPPPQPSQPGQRASPPYREIMDAYNGLCVGAGMPEAKHLTETRRHLMRTRWKSPLFRTSWRELFVMAAKSPWLCGTNPAGWAANFGWILESNEHVAKILEGCYANNGRAQGGVARPSTSYSGGKAVNL